MKFSDFFSRVFSCFENFTYNPRGLLNYKWKHRQVDLAKILNFLHVAVCFSMETKASSKARAQPARSIAKINYTQHGASAYCYQAMKKKTGKRI